MQQTTRPRRTSVKPMQYWKLWILTMALGATIQHGQSSLFFPSNSAYGIFAAIAVPLDLPHRNIFVSYNFEANYNLPQNWAIPSKWATSVEGEDLFVEEARLDSEANPKENYSGPVETSFQAYIGNTTKIRNTSALNSLLSRRNFYRVLLDKFQRSAYEGEPCLLRLICEINSSELGDINGVLGSLIHIMFTITTSKNENLPLKYYQAEQNGIRDQCHQYNKSCSGSLLDVISSPLDQIVYTILNNKI